MAKNGKKDCSDAIETFCYHVVTMWTKPLQITAATIKISAIIV